MASRLWVIGLAALGSGASFPAVGQEQIPSLLPPVESKADSGADMGVADGPPALPELKAPVPDEEDEDTTPPPGPARVFRPEIPRAEPYTVPMLTPPRELGPLAPQPFPGATSPDSRSRAEATTRNAPNDRDAGAAAPKPTARAGRDSAGASVVPSTTKDVEIQRKLHRQIVQAAGPRLKGLSVVVKDRTIRIDAQTRFFWQRRNVQRAIEDLPAIPGHRVSIQVR